MIMCQHVIVVRYDRFTVNKCIVKKSHFMAEKNTRAGISKTACFPGTSVNFLSCKIHAHHLRTLLAIILILYGTEYFIKKKFSCFKVWARSRLLLNISRLSSTLLCRISIDSQWGEGKIPASAKMQ